MKKLFAVLAAVLLLAIMACSGKSDDSNSSSSTSSNTTSAIVNSTGGSVQLADGANITIPAGVVADKTQVTLTKLAQPQLYASKATAVTDTYQISIPAGSITDQSSSNNFVTVQIPVSTSISATVKKALSHIKAAVTNSNADDSYNASEVTISNGTSTNALYGSYLGTGTINFPASALTSTSNNTSINVTGICVKIYFPEGTALYNVTPPSVGGGTPIFTSVNVDQTANLAVSGKTPIILIHGWQINRDSSNAQDIWPNFINYFNSNNDLSNKYELYSFSYDSTQHIEDNGNALASTITACFPSNKVVIIAHSMGGLVSHSYIQKHGGGSKVIKLITLGTPYHGSPWIQYLQQKEGRMIAGGVLGAAVVGWINIFTTLNTAGATDLAWDNYDKNLNIPDPVTTYLSDLNNSLKTQYANLYNAFYGNGIDISDSSHEFPYCETYFNLALITGYDSDGIVPIVSAYNVGHPDEFDQTGPEINYDHSQMAEGRTGSTDPLFAQIKNVLLAAIADTSTYAISGSITLNGTGLAGVIVTLTETASSALTDATGGYTFTTVADGNYTVTPSLTGYTFSPSSTTVNVSGANVTTINFTAAVNTAPTYSMSGTIHTGSNSGAVLSGAIVSIAGKKYTTGGFGTFTIAGIPAGTYAFSVSESGFDTYIDSAYYVGADQTGLNFYLIPSSTPNDYTSPNIGTLRYVPAGSFQRDSTSTDISIISTAFRMTRYEITRAQFLAIMGTDPSDTTHSTGTSDPVQNVNWYHAIAFCNKLSIAEGLTPAYSISGVNFSTLTYAQIPTSINSTWDAATVNWGANGYRLPTEVEWMWAAMGATSGYGYTSGTYTTGYDKDFAGSTGHNTIGGYVWYYSNSFSKTHPVGSMLPNELGLYDMSGNVWEWCWDWYDNGSYPAGTLTDYRGPATGVVNGYRNSQGGSWNSLYYDTTLVSSFGTAPSNNGLQFGFRVVRP
jgi:sulfatase modifying factor 1